MADQFGLCSILFCAAISGCAIGQKSVGETATDAKPDTEKSAAVSKDLKFTIKTTQGVIEGNIFASKAPVTAANFCNLIAHKYYDGIIFHRVIPDFMIQVGDPLTKQPGTDQRWGSGGPGYNFENELRRDLAHDKPGILSMANTGRPRTNGSQIFITHVPTPHLDGRHSVFGEVTKGQDVVNKIRKGDKIIEAKVVGDTAPLFKAHAKRIAEWNTALKKAGHIAEKK
ncbi:peptidylprolyl isomerase [Planctomycetota bacterium]